MGSHVGARHDRAALGHVQQLGGTLADAADGELVQERASDGVHLDACCLETAVNGKHSLFSLLLLLLLLHPSFTP